MEYWRWEKARQIINANETQTDDKHSKQRYEQRAAIAPWFRLHLPFISPGFESQAHHLRFFQFVLLKF